MKNLLLSVSLLLLFVSSAVFAQQTAPDDDGVVKITTDLVQVDAIVVDKDGKPVTNVKADEFEILQDGKPQKITNFSFISQLNQTLKTTPNAPSQVKNEPVPPINLPASTAGRILTFIVDDGNCAASTIGMTASRQALEKFIKEQMQPGDRVAIYQTRAGSSMLQQYTSDKSLLLQTARKIRWYPPQGSCGASDGSFYERASPNAINEVTENGITSKSIESERDRARRERIEDAGNNSQTVGAVGVINYVVRGLERVPGRKIVFFLSDGMALRARAREGSAESMFLPIFDVMRSVTDAANRASVVLNTIDVRGLYDLGGLDARDGVDVYQEYDPGNPSGTATWVNRRQRQANIGQDGLNYIASETGGNFYRGSNNLDVHFERALSQEQGYYLIGYEPDENTFKGKDFNKIEIRVRRPDLKVISRAGFLGKPDTDKKRKQRTADSDLYEALVAPLPRAGLNLRLTAFFGSDAETGNFVRSLVNLSGSEISFADDGKGGKKAVFDVVAVTLNEKNQVVDEFNKTHTITVDANTANIINRIGLVYSADIPVKKEGTYNLRVAIRDANSKQLGSAGQTITVPNLKKSGLYLSGLTIGETDAKGNFVSPSTTKPENGFAYLTSKSAPSVRQFKKGMIAAYSYLIYNAKKSNGQPNLTAQVKLYRDGVLVSEGAPESIKINSQSNTAQLSDFGYLRINEAVPAGDYAIQITVKDLQTNQTVSQWIDFEVVN